MHHFVHALAASLWLALPAFAAPEPQDCSAFPYLAELVVQIDTLETTRTQAATLTAALRIEELRNKIPTSHMRTRLEDLGLSRHLNEVTAFRVRLGALSRIARTGGRDGLQPYLFGSGFQQSKQHIRELLDRICDDIPSTDPSRAAWREITLWSGTGLAARPPLAVTAGFGLLTFCVAMLAALHSYRRWRRRRDKRIGKRVACNIPVSVSCQGAAQQTALVDISHGGANLAHRLGLHVGQSLGLEFGETRVGAQVMWANDKFAGVKFERVLSSREMAAAFKHQPGPATRRNEKRGARLGTA